MLRQSQAGLGINQVAFGQNSVNTVISLGKNLIFQYFLDYRSLQIRPWRTIHCVCNQQKPSLFHPIHDPTSSRPRLWKSYFDKNLCKPTLLGMQDAMNFGRTIKIQYSFASCEALQRGFL
jgi:hypothetical protein